MIKAFKYVLARLLLGGVLPAVLAVVRETRAAWRLLRLGLLLGRGLWLVRFHFPRWSEARRKRVKQRWSRRLVRCLGLRLPASALDLPAGALIVCNHISWLDIFIINALTPTHFVCKDEVRDWPLIGWLVESAETVFIARGSRAAAARAAREIQRRLALGDRVVVFPEGTTTQGTQLLPFRAALFQAAVETEGIVQPLALRYVDRQGCPALAPAYAGETSFWACLGAIARASALRVEVQVLESLHGGERRELARLAETRIALALGLPCPAEAPLLAPRPAHPDEAREALPIEN